MNQEYVLPGPDEARTYTISLGLFQVLRVVIIGVPKCLWCESPVTILSMGGPLICGWCDIGENPDGTKWSEEDYRIKRANFLRRIDEYKQCQKTLRRKNEG